MSEPAVVVDHLAKSFVLPHERVHTLKERALHPFRRPGHDRLDALRDVSFTVGSGEFFGIVGRNGSGKSTLLKCLAGVYRADAGTIRMRGRLSTFIELGVGFNPELAARDNIVMNGVMLGLSPREARARVDEVIAFAELEEFADLKLKNYSSGMHVRLAFSVAIQVDADVLLIDEVLAVGDASFQQKCFDVFADMRDQGRTILFVTHDMGAVERFCHRALLLERGGVVALGAPRDVAARYLALNFEQLAQAGAAEDEDWERSYLEPRGGDGRARVQEAWIEDADGERRPALMQGDRCVVKARVRFHEDVEDPSFAVAFVNDLHQNQFVVSTAVEQPRTGRFAAGEEIVFAVGFDCVFAPGRYHLSVVVAQRGGGDEHLDRWERITSFLVGAASPGGGLVDLPHDVTISRVGVAEGVR